LASNTSKQKNVAKIKSGLPLLLIDFEKSKSKRPRRGGKKGYILLKLL
jgi:hypothetical protein